MFPKAKNLLSALQYVQCLKQKGMKHMAEEMAAWLLRGLEIHGRPKPRVWLSADSN